MSYRRRLKFKQGTYHYKIDMPPSFLWQIETLFGFQKKKTPLYVNQNCPQCGCLTNNSNSRLES